MTDGMTVAARMIAMLREMDIMTMMAAVFEDENVVRQKRRRILSRATDDGEKDGDQQTRTILC